MTAPLSTPPTPEQRAAARAHLQAAMAATGQGPEWPQDTAPAAVHQVGVVGAGTMGTGIAQALAAAGVQVCLVDAQASALQRARDRIARSLQGAVARGRLDAPQAETTLARLHTATRLHALAEADAVIEAVYENAALKQQLLGELHAVCKPAAWLASNTSTLDIDALAVASGRPGQVLGLHFLTPAHVVPLVEVVRGAATQGRTLAAAAALVQRMGKHPVQTANAWGFIGNRLFEGYLREADALLQEGLGPARVDGALQAFGMAMGPLRTVDMAGLDIAEQVMAERARALPGGWPAAHRAVTRRLAALGRLGVKTGRGHYRYDGTAAQPDDELEALCAALAQELGVPRRADPGDEALLQRCLRPLVTEGRAALAEGVACRESDIDLVWVLGYGFPADRGGPMHLARSLGW